jgi:hypothetical protein
MYVGLGPVRGRDIESVEFSRHALEQYIASVDLNDGVPTLYVGDTDGHVRTDFDDVGMITLDRKS